MDTHEKVTITVETTVARPVSTVWDAWTDPKHIVNWNQASDDWHTPWAENDLRPGGRFTSRMEARDGSTGFDFGGVYDDVAQNELLIYTMDDGRQVTVTFTSVADGTQVVETFDAEHTYTIEQQREGWQSILDHFKAYVESQP